MPLPPRFRELISRLDVLSNMHLYYLDFPSFLSPRPCFCSLGWHSIGISCTKTSDLDSVFIVYK